MQFITLWYRKASLRVWGTLWQDEAERDAKGMKKFSEKLSLWSFDVCKSRVSVTSKIQINWKHFYQMKKTFGTHKDKEKIMSGQRRWKADQLDWNCQGMMYWTPLNFNAWTRALVWWLWEEIYVLKVVGSNTTAVYWMDIFYINLL